MKITIAKDLNKQAVKNAYAQAVIDLNTMMNTNNPNNAQVISGVKRQAEILKQLLEFIKTRLID